MSDTSDHAMDGAPGSRAAAALRAAALLVVALGGLVAAPTPAPAVTTGEGRAAASARWTAAWTTAMAGTGPVFTDQTLRLVVRTHMAGDRVRLRLSNRFSGGPVTLDGMFVGHRAQGASVVPGTNRAVTVGGRRRVVLRRGGVLVTDPVSLGVGAFRDLAVSFHVVGRARLDTHPNAYRRSYATPPRSGSKGAAASGAAFRRKLASVHVLDGVDVLAPGHPAVVVAFGDSITDGTGTTPDAERRWPDALAGRLAAAGRRVSVVNAGIAGNSVTGLGLREQERGVADVLGRPGVERFAHDVLSRAGVTDVIVFIGINDLADGTSGDAVIAAYRRLVARAHAHGVGVLGATLLPPNDRAHRGPVVSAQRAKVNRWIRTGGAFDAVLDFDAALRDPADPERLLPAYDSGDHLHPNDAGARAIARAVDLAVLDRRG